MGHHRPLLVSALKAALLLGAVASPWIAAPALAEDPVTQTPAQRLAGMEAEYDAVMQEAAQLGTGRTIDESIRFSTNRQGQTRVDMERLEEAIKRQGGTVQDLTAARDRFKNETVLGPKEVGEEIVEEGVESLATRGLSVIAQRAIGVAMLIGDVVEYGGKKYIKSLNVSDMNALIAQGRLQQTQLLDMYGYLTKQLNDEIRAQARLRQLAERRRQLFEKIARERQRQNLGPGKQSAVFTRDTDAAGDRALAEEEARERLNNSVRLSDPAEAARRKAELDRGGRGVGPGTPLSYHAPGFGVQGLNITGALTIGYNYSDLPTSAGVGFKRPSGGDETFASRKPDDLELMAFALIFFGDIGEDWVLTTAMQYAWGDEEDEGFEDEPGLTTGFVYGDFSPGGSTGLNIGNRRLDWRTGVDVASVNVEAKLTRRSDGPATWFLYADALHINRDYDGWARGQVVFPGMTYDLTQSRSQEVTDTLIGVGGGVQFGAPVTPWLNIGGWASAGGFWRRSELDSRERNVCGLCSAPDADFTLNIDDDDDGLTWAVAMGLFGEIPLGDKVSIGLGVDASYIDEVGAVYNPSSGDDLFLDGKHTALTSDSLLTWGVRAGIKFRF